MFFLRVSPLFPNWPAWLGRFRIKIRDVKRPKVQTISVRSCLCAHARVCLLALCEGTGSADRQVCELRNSHDWHAFLVFSGGARLSPRSHAALALPLPLALSSWSNKAHSS